jgi:hypothetical protein
MTAFKTSVRIRRPIEDTFTFAADPLKPSALELCGSGRPADGRTP